MTSDEHLTLDELAELDEGLLTPDRDPQVRRHLAACTQCQKLADDLTTASGVLRSLGPVPMPADVAARIDQALAAAATPEAATPEAAPALAVEPAAGADVVPNLADVRARRRWVSAPTTAAATIVVLAVVAIVIGVTHKSHPSGREDALAPGTSASLPVGSGGAGSSAPQIRMQRTGRVYNSANLESLAPALVKADFAATNAGGEGGVSTPSSAVPPKPTAAKPGRKLVYSTNSTGSTKASAGTNGTTSSPAGAKSTKHRKAGQLAPGSAVQAGPEQRVPASLVPYENSITMVQQCGTFNSPSPGAQLLAVDLGRWTNAQTKQVAIPALVLVYSDPSDATMNVVFVVKPPCGGGDVLKFESVPAAT